MDKVDQKQETLDVSLSSKDFVEKVCKTRVWGRDKAADDKVLDALGEILKREGWKPKNHGRKTRKG